MLNHLKKRGKCNELNNNFVTIDIETIKKDNKLIPYLICGYNGSSYISSYGSQVNELFSSFINQLFTFFTNDSNTLIVYAHNFSGFDGIFLLKHLLSFGKVEPLLHNGKLITIKLIIGEGEFKDKTIIFKDSYLLLPNSLRELCKAFNVSSAKGYFPFNLTNIFYQGLLPEIELWNNIPSN